jgi:hypothetical protein
MMNLDKILSRMKTQLLKIAAFLILLIVFYKNVSAQETAFGLKGGLNLTNLKVTDPQASYNSRVGYHLGIFLRAKYDRVAFQPELLLYTQKNEINYFASAINAGTVENSFTYLAVPILLKFYLVSGLNLQAGPQLGFLLDGDQKWNTALYKGTRNIKDSYKGIDVALSLGAGWESPFGVDFDLRYNLGVKDINDVSNGEAAKSRVFLLSLGWNFLKHSDD